MRMLLASAERLDQARRVVLAEQLDDTAIVAMAEIASREERLQVHPNAEKPAQIGRASCRERV